ncbi:MAG: pentapeptide repeat-containing protein, partial [Caldilineaceae bacterium]
MTRQPNKDAPFFRRRRAAEAEQAADRKRLLEERRAVTEKAEAERERQAELTRTQAAERQDWLFDQAKDRLTAANAAIGTTRTFFFALLSIAAYIGVVVWGTTDEQLLRISPIKLPLIGVEVPLTSFYLFVPWLFVLLHLNLLMHLGLTSRKLKVFLDLLRHLERERADYLRNDVSNFPLAQWLVGHNDRIFHLFLSVLVVILLLLIPPYLLFWMLVRFLAFQSEEVAWSQAIATTTDILMILSFFSWFYWQVQSARRQKGGWEKVRRKLDRVLAVGLKLVVWPLTLALLVLPGIAAPYLASRLADRLPAGQSRTSFCGTIGPLPLKVEWQGALLKSLCAQYQLVVREGFLTRNTMPARAVNALRGDDRWARAKALDEALGLPLRGRSLKWADFGFAVLPKADLRQALLQGADLSNAELQGADFEDAQLQGADLSRAQLQYA